MNLLVMLGSLLLATAACEIEPKRTLDAASGAGGSRTDGKGSKASGGAPPAAGASESGGGAGEGAAGEPSAGGNSAGEAGAPRGEEAGGASGAAAGGESGADGSGAGAGGSEPSRWVGTWAAGPQLTEANHLPPAPGLANNTLRQVVRVSLGGERIRARFSNEYGNGPVTLSSVHVARSTGASAIDPASALALSFAGVASVTIPPGEIAWSDPFDFALAPLSKVTVSIHFGSVPSDVTGHPGSRATSYLASGDTAAAPEMSSSVRTEHWYFLTGIDVMAEAGAAAVVVLGDSISDGRGSTTNGNDRWPDVLASRLQGNPATAHVAVLNLGIGGNAVVTGGLGPTARARFDSQVLAQSGVRFVIVLEGVNDIGASASTNVAQSLITAYREFITKSRAAGVSAYGVPILPFGGSSYDSETHEAARAIVNEWIRTSGEWDAVIDLDAAVRDPNDPTALLPAYDSGDHLHLNPAGYRSMGEAVALELFRAR